MIVFTLLREILILENSFSRNYPTRVLMAK